MKQFSFCDLKDSQTRFIRKNLFSHPFIVLWKITTDESIKFHSDLNHCPSHSKFYYNLIIPFGYREKFPLKMRNYFFMGIKRRNFTVDEPNKPLNLYRYGHSRLLLISFSLLHNKNNFFPVKLFHRHREFQPFIFVFLESHQTSLFLILEKFFPHTPFNLIVLVCIKDILRAHKHSVT